MTEPRPGTPPPVTGPTGATATTTAISSAVTGDVSKKMDTKKWTEETEDLLKTETPKHRDCVLAIPPRPEATPLPGNVPEAANGKGLGRAHLPGAH